MPPWAGGLHVKGLSKTEVSTAERTPSRWKRLFSESHTSIQCMMLMLRLIAAVVDHVVQGHLPVTESQLKKKNVVEKRCRFWLRAFSNEGLSMVHVPQRPFPENPLQCVQLSRTVRTLFFATADLVLPAS